jgi:hypothetical protein
MSDIDIETEDGSTYRIVGLSPRGRAWLAGERIGTIVSTVRANRLLRRMCDAGLGVLIDGKPHDAGHVLNEQPRDFDEEAASAVHEIENAMQRPRPRKGWKS